MGVSAGQETVYGSGLEVSVELEFQINLGIKYIMLIIRSLNCKQ